MANLIITVIAIALVAVASLMGAYYGGAAFLNNQSAANASTVLNQGQQVQGAWSAYLNDNLNVPPTSITALTTGAYLANVPETPAEAGGVTALPMLIAQVGTHYYAYADMGMPGSAGAVITDPNASACLHIIKTATGANATTVAKKAPGVISAQGTTGNGTFGCSASSAAPSPLGGIGTPPAAGDYTMEYKLS